jgi:5-methylcytosine-specific restriction protein A
MPWKPPRPCPAGPPPCPLFVTTPGAYQCDDHTRSRRQASDRTRGTFRQRGYGPLHGASFRAGVLARDPTCVCVDCPEHGGGRCLRESSIADHWPLSRRQLAATPGADPDDPVHGRGLCKVCHDRSTAREQPGGWNRR